MPAKYSDHTGPAGAKRGGVIAAQEFAISVTEYEIRMGVIKIQRLRHVFEMVKVNSLPRLRDARLDRRAAEAIVKNLNDAAREGKTEELKERIRLQFLQKQLANQRKNLARLKGIAA